MSRKKLRQLETRIAALEKSFQSQQEIMVDHINNHEKETTELRSIFNSIKEAVYGETQHRQ